MPGYRILRTSLLPATAAILALAATPAAHAIDYAWANGTFVAGTTAPSPLAAGDRLVLSTNAAKIFSTSPFTNEGTVVVGGAGNVRFNDGAQVVNNGTWDMQSSGIGLVYFSGAAGTFTNNGTLLRSTTTGIATIGTDGMNVVNNGAIVVDTGSTLRFSAAGTVFNAGTTMSGAGVVELRANTTFNGAFSSQNLVAASGTITANAAVLTGTMEWQAGTIQGGWQVGTGQQMSLTTVGSKNITGTGTLLDNRGTIEWQNAGGIVVGAGATLRNQGVLRLTGTSGGNSVTGAGTLLNEGLITHSGGIGLNLAMSGGTLVNNGVIEAADDGTITLPGAFANSGVLSGVGSFSVGGTGLVNNGVLAPGAGRGAGLGTLTLRTSNSFAQGASGTLAIGITSLAEHDLLQVFGSGFGSAALDGTLRLQCVGACSLAVGDVVTVLSTASGLTGQFSNVVLDGFGSGAFEVLYEVNNGADFVRLRVTQAVTAAVPEPGPAALLLAGLLALGFVSRRRGT